MRLPRFLRLIFGLVLVLLVLACDVLQSAVPQTTPDLVATEVARLKTSEAVQASARATLTAEPSKVKPTLTPLPPTATQTLVPPTVTSTNVPVVGTSTSVPNIGTVKGVLVDGNTNKPLTNVEVMLGFFKEDNTQAVWIREGMAYPQAQTDSTGAFIIQFDADWLTKVGGKGPFFLTRFPHQSGVSITFRAWRSMDWNLVTLQVGIGQTLDLGIVRVQPP